MTPWGDDASPKAIGPTRTDPRLGVCGKMVWKTCMLFMYQHRIMLRACETHHVIQHRNRKIKLTFNGMCCGRCLRCRVWKSFASRVVSLIAHVPPSPPGCVQLEAIFYLYIELRSMRRWWRQQRWHPLGDRVCTWAPIPFSISTHLIHLAGCSPDTADNVRRWMENDSYATMGGQINRDSTSARAFESTY